MPIYSLQRDVSTLTETTKRDIPSLQFGRFSYFSHLYQIVVGKAGFVLYQLVQASGHFFYPLVILPGIDIQLPPIMPNLSEEQVTT